MSAIRAFSLLLRLLSIRDRSGAELESSLRKRGFAEGDIVDALARCRELGYLDDARFASSRAASLLRSGRAAGRKTLSDLLVKGIDETLARRALEEAEREFPPEEVLADLLQRRFPEFDFRTSDDRQKRRVIGFFQRRGFPSDTIFKVILNRE